MNREGHVVIPIVLVSLASVFWTSCGSSSPKTVSTTAKMSATGGSGQTVKAGGKFEKPLSVTVTSNGSPLGGLAVTFTAPSSGASGTFVNGNATETDITDSNGVTTSSAFTANKTAGSYTVTAAAAAGASTPASFNLTNQAASTANYSFYVSGLEAICGAGNYAGNYYALAGSVTIDSSGNVVSGEQDYNDAFGCTSPEPSGDTITGGALTVDGTGQGTLTLVTNNSNLGVSGTETLGVQFVNTGHAMIIQFDASATSSGSMDMQTLPSTLSGGYAFTLSGVDSIYYPVARGGVFSISGDTFSNGVFDENDGGTVTTGTPFSGTLSTPDSFGRGTITGTGMANTIVYYIVGPEAIRIINVDPTTSAVGSAFGQGTSTFTNASLEPSVFSFQANNHGVLLGLLGMFTVPSLGTFQGVADYVEDGVISGSGFNISGNYSISNTVGGVPYNGYGNLTITSPRTPPNVVPMAPDVTTMGVYLADPNLNLNDPNNAAGGGGALVLELDPYLAGSMGVLTPQTDTATASFAGNYAFGAQDYYIGDPGSEFDFVGQGPVGSGNLSGVGLVNDPFCFFVEVTMGIYSDVPFSGTLTPDPLNVGRYTIPLNVTAGGSTVPFQVIVYQASGGQLFWIDEEPYGSAYPNDQIIMDQFSGSLQRQGWPAGLPAAIGSGGKTPATRKH